MMLPLVEAKNAYFQKILRSDISSLSQFDTADEAFKDFKSGILSIVKNNLDLLDEVPLHHDLQLEDIRAFLEEEIKKNLTEDPSFEKSIEIGRYSRNMLESMDAYFREIFHFHDTLKDTLRMESISVSKMYLNSDLPLSFMNTVADSLLAEIDYVVRSDKTICKEKLALFRSRSNRSKFERVCGTHNAWVRRFTKRRAQMEHERVRLIWYVDFNNSKNVEEIFKDKFCTIDLLETSILNDCIGRLEKETEEMERLNFSEVEFKSILEQDADIGTQALLRMMHIIEQRER